MGSILGSGGKSAIPTFCQFVTNEFFKEIIKLKHPFDRKGSEASHVISMEHKNALRYVAGHVCRKVQRQLRWTR